MNKIEKDYDLVASKYIITHKNRFVDKIFEHFLLENLPNKKNLKILDAGGGVGRFSFNLSRMGHEIVLTDISKKMISEAEKYSRKKKIKNISFFKESITNMKNQEDSSFDIVIMMNSVLDYCENHKLALKEVRRVLKKGGIFMGTVNNRFIYTSTNVLLKKGGYNVKGFKESFKTGNYKNYSRWLCHDFTLDELKIELKKVGRVCKIIGVTNLLRKWEYPKYMKKNEFKELLELQIEFSKRNEFINNSSDFFFVVKK